MKSAAAAYRTGHFEHAPPLKLVQLLYEGALRFLDQAGAAHAGSEPARFQERCLRVQSIVAELRLALDARQAPELAESLNTLYLFLEGEIRSAMLAQSAAPLASVREILATLLDGWRGLEVQP